MCRSIFSNDAIQGQTFPYYFPDLHDTNKSIDPPTQPNHHLGTKALGVHLKGAQLGGDAFNNFNSFRHSAMMTLMIENAPQMRPISWETSSNKNHVALPIFLRPALFWSFGAV
jgi:hypothetical protein